MKQDIRLKLDFLLPGQADQIEPMYGKCCLSSFGLNPKCLHTGGVASICPTVHLNFSKLTGWNNAVVRENTY